MTIYTSRACTTTTTTEEAVEHTFATWVYLDKCDDFQDIYGGENIKLVVDMLGSETACIRALILHGYMANGQRTGRRDLASAGANGLRGPTPLEAFKQALRIGLAAAGEVRVSIVNMPTRPWERNHRSIFWYPAPTPPDLPVFIPRPQSSRHWTTLQPSGAPIEGGTNVILAPNVITKMDLERLATMSNSVDPVWSCADARIRYLGGMYVVAQRITETTTKTFVITGLPQAYPRVLYHPQPDPSMGPLQTIAHEASPQDVKETPILLIWSCAHGDLFVQAPQKASALPPISSLNLGWAQPSSSSSRYSRVEGSQANLFLATPIQDQDIPRPSQHQGGPTSASAVRVNGPRQLLSALHPSSLAMRSASAFSSARPLPRLKLRPESPSAVSHQVLPVPQRPIAELNERRLALSHTQSLTIPSAGPSTLQIPPPQPPPSPLNQSISTKGKGKRRESNPKPKPTSIFHSPPTFRLPTPGPSTIGPSFPAPGPVNAEAEAEADDADADGADWTIPCGFPNCHTTLTPSTWEDHYGSAHRLSERTWAPHGDCPHAACVAARAEEAADPKRRGQTKWTFGCWLTYKRHIKQAHLPGGRLFPCTFPGCTVTLSRADALIRHVRSAHESNSPAARKRVDRKPAPARAAAAATTRKSASSAAPTSKAAGKKKAAHVECSALAKTSAKERVARAKASAKRMSARVARESTPGVFVLDMKGRHADVVQNCHADAGASSEAGPSRMQIDGDVKMAEDDDDDDDSEFESKDQFGDDEFPEGDVIPDEDMGSDPDNYD